MDLFDFIFPKNCLGCGKEGSYICTSCIKKSNPARSICPYCYKPSIDGFTHIKCGRKLGLDGLTSIWEYEGVIRRAILSLKYKYATVIGRELQAYVVTELGKKILPAASCLVPVPVHWHKENVRGFNQSVVIGQEIVHKMGWDFQPDLVIKKVPTRAQAILSGEERRHNLKGAFAINPIHKFLFLNLKSVVLFDDVFTTGSTLKEAAKVLKRAGVEKVWGLTIVR